MQCSFYGANQEVCTLAVPPRQFSFHILTVETLKTSDPNVYPGPIISASLLIKKTGLGVDSARPLGVHIRTESPSSFGLMDWPGRNSSARPLLPWWPTAAPLHWGQFRKMIITLAKSPAPNVAFVQQQPTGQSLLFLLHPQML